MVGTTPRYICQVYRVKIYMTGTERDLTPDFRAIDERCLSIDPRLDEIRGGVQFLQRFEFSVRDLICTSLSSERNDRAHISANPLVTRSVFRLSCFRSFLEGLLRESLFGGTAAASRSGCPCHWPPGPHTAAAGVPPQGLLPMYLDAGTNNEGYLKNPLYVGLRKHRPS